MLCILLTADVGGIPKWQADASQLVWFNGWILVILIAWLAGVSLVLLLTVMCIIVICCRQKKVAKSLTQNADCGSASGTATARNADGADGKVVAANDDGRVGRMMWEPIAQRRGSSAESPASQRDDDATSATGIRSRTHGDGSDRKEAGKTPAWHNTLREESFHHYSIGTILAPITD